MPEDKAVLALLRCFVDAVKAGGSLGAPAGVLYSGVCDKMTLSQFQGVMAALVKLGNIRQSGHLYHFVSDL